VNPPALEIKETRHKLHRKLGVSTRREPRRALEVIMSLAATHLRLPLVALGAAAFASLAPLAPASAATVVHHPSRAVHRHVAHGYAGHHVHHYAYRHGHRYAGYGYNPGAAVVGTALGLGAAAAYPYGCDPYSYGPWGSNGCADTSDWGGYYGPAYGGFGYGYGPGYYGGGYGGGHFGHGYGHGFGFQGGGAPRIAGGSFGHMGGFRGHAGGFGGRGGGGGGHFMR
jgi:hypothetical protein